MKSFLKQLLAALVVLSMVGCTTIQPLSANGSELSHTLKKGDKVELTTTKGQQLNFKVDSVDETGLQGGGQRVAYNDIQSINRKEIDTKNTTFVVLGILAAGALAAAAGGGGGGGGGAAATNAIIEGTSGMLFATKSSGSAMATVSTVASMTDEARSGTAL